MFVDWGEIDLIDSRGEYQAVLHINIRHSISDIRYVYDMDTLQIHGILYGGVLEKNKVAIFRYTARCISLISRIAQPLTTLIPKYSSITLPYPSN